MCGSEGNATNIMKLIVTFGKGRVGCGIAILYESISTTVLMRYKLLCQYTFSQIYSEQPYAYAVD